MIGTEVAITPPGGPSNVHKSERKNNGAPEGKRERERERENVCACVHAYGK